MKKFILALLIVLFTATPGFSLDLAWDHSNPGNVSEYSIYYEPTDGSLGPFNIVISDGMSLSVSIPEEHFKPGLEYTIYATAWNEAGESLPSNSVVYQRNGWGPPTENLPLVLYIRPGNPQNLRNQ